MSPNSPEHFAGDEKEESKWEVTRQIGFPVTEKQHQREIDELTAIVDSEGGIDRAMADAELLDRYGLNREKIQAMITTIVRNLEQGKDSISDTMISTGILITPPWDKMAEFYVQVADRYLHELGLADRYRVTRGVDENSDRVALVFEPVEQSVTE